MDIEWPTQEEKNAAIEGILSAGLRKPESLWQCLNGLGRALGFRLLFWDTSGSFWLSMAALGVALVFQPAVLPAGKYAATFGLSPFIFALVVFVVETMECHDRTYGLKMTCKYTIRQVTAFRILCFGLAGTLFCVWLSGRNSDTLSEFLDLLALACASLFACAFLCLFLIRHLPGQRAYAAGMLAWAALALVPAIAYGKEWERALSAFPPALALCTAVLSACLCLHETKKIMFSQHGEVSNAVG